MRAKSLVLLCILAVAAAAGRHPLAVKNKAKKGKTASIGDTWEEMTDPEGIEAHADMSKWLEAFFAATPASELAPRPPSKFNTQKEAQELPILERFTDTESISDKREWKTWLSETTCDDLIAKKPAIDPSKRKYLVIAPVGSAFNAAKWMTHPKHATYDIIALYYGKSDNFTCPLCRAVIRGPGVKFELLKKYIQNEPENWAQMYEQYDAIMLPDDDLNFHDTCKLNRIFEIFSSYNIVLGQPSVCQIDHASTYWPMLYQYDGLETYSILRYVTFIEIMAPIFRTDFFKGFILPSIWNAYAGWGFDFTWPYMMRYPKRHLAVIDEVCMIHENAPGANPGESVYSADLPFGVLEEESRRFAEFGYVPYRVEAMGYPFRNLLVLGVVKKEYFSAEDVPSEGRNGSEQESQARAVVDDDEEKTVVVEEEKEEEVEKEEKKMEEVVVEEEEEKVVEEEKEEEKSDDENKIEDLLKVVRAHEFSRKEWSWYISYVYTALIAGVGLLAMKLVGRKDQIFVKYWPLRRGKSIKAHSSSATLT